MSSVSVYATVLASAAVGVVLLLGLGNMLRNGSANLSQTLMRWRIGLQAIAIVVAMLAIYLAK
ncbi:MAG: twin transmembrane helix small protein [Hyphomicrobiaceae bacterium]